MKDFYLEQESDGNVPAFTLKNTGYWFKHDLRHIYKSLIYSLKHNINVLPFLIAYLAYYVYIFDFEFRTLVMSGIKAYLVLFVLYWAYIVLRYKGYSIYDKQFIRRRTQFDYTVPLHCLHSEHRAMGFTSFKDLLGA